MKTRNVWIVNHYAGVPSKGGGGRHFALAQRAAIAGWNPTLFLASTKHPGGQQLLSGFARRKIVSEGGVRSVWVRTNGYGYSKVLRVLGMGAFTLNLLLPGMTRGLERPDIVVGSTVHPLAAWAGWRLARRYRVPFVFEIRDVWPETLIDYGALSENSMATRLLRNRLAQLARSASAVIAPLPYVDLWLNEVGLPDSRFVWIPNSVEFTEETMPEVPSRVDQNQFTLMYLGSHGNANALHTLLDAFDLACRERPDLELRLRLVGDGPAKPKLQDQARALSSGRKIWFEDQIPRHEVTERAREADCLIATLADKPVYKYGASLNKLFTYLNAARPIIWAANAPNNPIRDANAGICVPSDDVPKLAAAIVEMADSDHARRKEFARNGWEHVREHYSFDVLGSRFTDLLDDLSGGTDANE